MSIVLKAMSNGIKKQYRQSMADLFVLSNTLFEQDMGARDIHRVMVRQTKLLLGQFKALQEDANEMYKYQLKLVNAENSNGGSPELNYLMLRALEYNEVVNALEKFLNNQDTIWDGLYKETFQPKTHSVQGLPTVFVGNLNIEVIRNCRSALEYTGITEQEIVLADLPRDKGKQPKSLACHLNQMMHTDEPDQFSVIFKNKQLGKTSPDAYFFKCGKSFICFNERSGSLYFQLDQTQTDLHPLYNLLVRKAFENVCD